MKIKRILSVITVIAILLMTLLSCGDKSYVKVSDMSLEDLEKNVTLCDYKGLEFVLDSKSKEEAILSYLDVNSAVKCPDGLIDYYVEQIKAQYQYYADQNGVKYEQMLDMLGEDNITIKAEAKRLIKKDMIFELIRRRENITLSDSEKEQFFDKYVEKYAEIYDYSEEYVREELSDFVYDSMLYDKTVEFLIIHNSFVESN